MKTKSNNKSVNKLVDNFTEHYQKEFDFYNAASIIAAQLIDGKLTSKGIRAIVTSRAKNPTRLFDKVKQRSSEKQYLTLDDIYKDIVDLSGVRVALYFDLDQNEIEEVINELFSVNEIKNFPTKGKSQGYRAIHYRVKFKPDVLTEQQKRYEKANIEIQVATLLMHAWAEVEHDMVYKPLSGSLSEDEKEILDELNNIVTTGEDALKRLKKASIKRNSFNDNYDLYEFLKFFISDKDINQNVIIGDTSRLYKYLLDNDIPTQKKLTNRLKDFNILIDENWNLADQIMDHIQGNQNKNIRTYLNSNKSKSKITAESAVGSFLIAWIELEKTLKRNDVGTSYKDTFIRLKSLVGIGLLSEEEYHHIYKLRNIRNQLVHGIEMPDNDYLEWHTDEIRQLTNSIRNKRQEYNYG
ncbi:hypothetical protein V6615_13110 [Oscillospiraceae bacterium PP1C4]